MDGEIATLLLSIRRWILIFVALSGVLLVGFVAVGYEVSGATDGALYAAIGVIGALAVIAAGLRALLTLFGGHHQRPRTKRRRPNDQSPNTPRRVSPSSDSVVV
jgi:hypothetical protein